MDGRALLMHDAIERLAAMMPPPATAPAAPPWHLAPAEVGFQFPDDYQDFADLYGSGFVNDKLLIWTPSLTWDKLRHGGAGKGFAELLAGPPAQIGDYLAQLHEDEPDENPYPVFPDEGGLLAWGNTFSANNCFWLTCDPDPNRWPIVAWNRSGTWHPFDGGFGEFLVANLQHEFPEWDWLVGDEQPPVWDMLTDWTRHY